MLGDDIVGEVTSGTFSPLLQTGIGLAYLWPADVAELGDEVEVDIRGRRGRATVVRPRSSTAALVRSLGRRDEVRQVGIAEPGSVEQRTQHPIGLSIVRRRGDDDVEP